MRIRPVFKGFNHKGIKITVAEKNIELTHRKLSDRKKAVHLKNSDVNLLHMKTKGHLATLKVTRDNSENSPGKRLEVNKEGVAFGKFEVTWDLEKNR